jgi:hypothetical protein
VIRRWLLRLLGYEFVVHTPYRKWEVCNGGSLDDAVHSIRHDAGQWLPMGVNLEIGVRHVSEVPPGTVRVVLEVCR